VDLNVIIGGAGDGGGIPQGELLAAFAEAVVGDDDDALAQSRSALTEVLGAEALVDACAVASMFNAIDRVADSTGIPIDEDRLEPTAEFRESLGISAFPSGRG
jgi:hypothetical protein